MLRVPLYFPCKSTNLRSASPLDFSQSLNATLDSTRTATRIYIYIYGSWPHSHIPWKNTDPYEAVVFLAQATARGPHLPAKIHVVRKHVGWSHPPDPFKDLVMDYTLIKNKWKVTETTNVLYFQSKLTDQVRVIIISSIEFCMVAQNLQSILQVAENLLRGIWSAALIISPLLISSLIRPRSEAYHLPPHS